MEKEREVKTEMKGDKEDNALLEIKRMFDNLYGRGEIHIGPRDKENIKKAVHNVIQRELKEG